MSTVEEIDKFLSRVYSATNLDTAPEKLRQAVTLLERVQVDQSGGIIDNRSGLQFEPSAYTPEDIL